MEIFHDLLEHPEDLLSQWRTASHAKAVWYSNLKDLHRFESLRQKNKQTILNNGGILIDEFMDDGYPILRYEIELFQTNIVL